MWGDVIEDFLDPLGWSLDDFLQRMSGGWLFGYIRALERQGIASTLILFTKEGGAPALATHADSGARVRILRAPTGYRALRHVIRTPYHWLEGDGRVIVPVKFPFRTVYALARDAMPYLATPVPALARVIAEEGCDAVICQEYEEPRFDAVIAAGDRAGVPVFASFQGARARRSRWEEGRRPRSMARVRGLIIGSELEGERVRQRYGVGAERIARIFNPLDDSLWFPDRAPDTRRSLGIAEDALVVAWHGRVSMRHKGLDVLLDAWSRVRPAPPSGALALVGVEGMPGGVGPQPPASVRNFLSTADVVVVPSRRTSTFREPWGLVVNEAMHAGTPVIATDQVGAAAGGLVRNGRNGLVVPSEDPAALAAALRLLRDDERLRARLGAAAVEDVAPYTFRAWAEGFAQPLPLA